MAGMHDWLVPPGTPASVAVEGTAARFAVHRIYCVGRNYAEHTREMGGDPHRDAPFFFGKPADALVASGESVPYPSRTGNFHHEIELVVALARGGRDIAVSEALDHVFGYAVGNDFTRRDLQHASRAAGQPWETSKGFDHSAAVGTLRPADRGHVQRGRIWLNVNGALRQSADVSEMTWKVPEIIAELSTFFELAPGDLIFTGTPAGVGALSRGDLVEGGIEGLATLANRIQ
ncbi:MAG TPA: fumarylacetoacetate hydrolase family protein [Steroidobacteraceae bacterium]|nr:fumarylacetoacetate hydrolase family protein [Steroidobacteraceae bacterium]